MPGDLANRLDVLASTLARPRNLAMYEEADLTRQTASLLWGMIHNHPFADGNKRAGLHIAFTFARVNGLAIVAPEDAVVELGYAVAEGRWDEDTVDAWLRRYSRPIARGGRLMPRGKPKGAVPRSNLVAAAEYRAAWWGPARDEPSDETLARVRRYVTHDPDSERLARFTAAEVAAECNLPLRVAHYDLERLRDAGRAAPPPRADCRPRRRIRLGAGAWPHRRRSNCAAAAPRLGRAFARGGGAAPRHHLQRGGDARARGRAGD